jgi:hypothetical protein
MIKLRRFSISYERGRQLLLFLFCLFLAFILWSVHKLSENYSIYLHYKVEVTTDIAGRASDAVSKESLVFRGKSSGFYILQHRYSGKENLIKLQLDRKYFKKDYKSKDGFFVISTDIRERLSQYFGETVEIEALAADTLHFEFPGQTNRRIPVSANVKLSFSNQYMAGTAFKLNPDSISVYGDISVIRSIDSLFTKPIKLENLSAGRQGVIALEQIPGIRYSQNEVYYSVDVVRYVEKSRQLEVSVINTPAGKSLIPSPREVTLIYREQFGSSKPGDPEKLSVFIDFLEFENTVNHVLKPQLSVVPDWILSYKFDPPFVEGEIFSKDTLK